jgi:predicted amidophosphoribosyltransferase
MSRPASPRSAGEEPGWLVEVAHAALDLVVPQLCAGCGRPGRAWCAACADLCTGPSLVVAGAVACRAAAPHSGPAGRAVVAFKDQGFRRLAAPLGDLLARAVLDVLGDLDVAPSDPVWLVPIPARRSARRARGADHMGVLAARAARRLRSRGVAAHRIAALRHMRDSRDQVGLDRAQRQSNVAGTLRGARVPPGLLVVVDDVTTTGATLGEAIRALRAVDGRTAAAASITWAAPGRHLASEVRRD